MTVRPAIFSDIPRLVAVLEDGHRRSVYADSAATLDVPHAKRVLVQSIQRHGFGHEGGTLAMVSEKDGQVEGMLIGILDRVQVFGTHLYATDMVFVGTEQIPPRDPARLIHALVAWAEGVPKCIEVKLGATNVIGDWRRAMPLYKRAGFSLEGGIFERRLNHVVRV